MPADLSFDISWSNAGLALLLFVATFAVSLSITAWIVIKLPADYFSDRRPPAFASARRHPILHWTLLILKNIAGVGIIALGLFLSLPGMPGQGLLTILIGLMLLNFPGKRRLEKKLVSRPTVRRTVDRLRTRFGARPLILDEDVPD